MKGLSRKHQLQDIMSLCTDLTQRKEEVQLLINLHRGNHAAIKEAGGHPTIARSLTEFRLNVVQQLCVKYEFIFKTLLINSELWILNSEFYTVNCPFS